MNPPLILCLFAFSTTFVPSNVQAYLKGEGIIGGEIAELGDFSYQVSLEVAGKNFCGGAIIDDTHVITAAHCVISKTGAFFGYPIKVIGGINNLRSNVPSRVAVDVVKVYVTGNYTPPANFARPSGDIAVLKLARPLYIASNPNLAAIELPELGRSFAGEEALISGFGWNWINVVYDPSIGVPKEAGGGTFGKMRYAEVYVLSNEQCQSLAEAISENHICGMVRQKSNRPEGVCSGDSGGPLVANGKTMIGVVSSSPLGCREDQEPAVYTRVSQYIDFIKKALMDQVDRSIRSTNLPIRKA